MLHKSRRIPCCFLRKKAPSPSASCAASLPILLAVCHPASTVRRVPEMVVVLAEFLFQTGDFFFLAFQEIIIQDLRSQNFVFCFPLLDIFLFGNCSGGCKLPSDKMFIPEYFPPRYLLPRSQILPLPFLSAPQMAEKDSAEVRGDTAC